MTELAYTGPHFHGWRWVEAGSIFDGWVIHSRLSVLMYLGHYLSAERELIATLEGLLIVQNPLSDPHYRNIQNKDSTRT